MTDVEPPKITFPCPDYPIKIMGDASPSFKDDVVNVVMQFAPDFDPASVIVHSSRNARFFSVNVSITAQSEAQLQDMFAALKKNPAVRMVL